LVIQQELLIGLNVPPTELKQKVKEWLVLELFREGSISAGKSAELLAMTKAQFIDLLDRHDIPYLDMNPVELAQDVAVAVAASKRPED
jgi:predicted HTH domain antitoxin